MFKLLFIGICATAHAEVYYNAFRLVGGDLQVNLTQNECITSCVMSVKCLAVSFCSWTYATCYFSSCGNIRLKPAEGCKTIVLSDALLPDELPDPVHEWIMTDHCGNRSTSSTGMLAGSRSTVTGYPASYYPSLSTRFGNAFSAFGSSLSYVFNNIQITLDGSFSVFFWFLPQNDTASFRSLRIYSQTTSKQILLTYNNQFTLSTTLNGCVSPCSFQSDFVLVASGQWHKIALIVDKNSTRLMLDDLKVLDVTLLQSVSPLTTEPLSISLDFLPGVRGATVYCFKVFNVSLSPAEFYNVAVSCTRGKIQYAKTSCPTSYLQYGKKSYYPQTDKTTMWEAYKTCEQQNQQLLKLDSKEEYDYIIGNLSTIYWTSLYGTKHDTTLTWLTDGSLRGPGFSFSLDYCCPQGLAYCYLVGLLDNTVRSIFDHGCADPFAAALCTCTEY